MIRLALSGAQGRVGKFITESVNHDKTFDLVVELLENNGGLSLLEKTPTDVLIDFTVPAATMEYLTACEQHGIPMVIGTTGFSAEQTAKITDAAKKIPIVYAPNMSVGVNLSLRILEFLTKAVGSCSDISLEETHHKNKRDKPSGTALEMAKVINDSLPAPVITAENITSRRLDEGAGQHTALFSLAGETLEIKHQALDRSVYAKGALQAASWLIGKKPGLYNMQDVLSI